MWNKSFFNGFGRKQFQADFSFISQQTFSFENLQGHESKQ
jgi:hypothetical protein